MLKRFATVSAVVLTLGFSTAANAVLMIDPSTVPQWTGNQVPQPQINTAIAPIIGTSVELYKQNVGGAEEGDLAGSYTTTFFNTASDPEDFTIEWDGGDIVGPNAYLLVKDGNQDPAWYLFDLTDLGWDGMETIEGTGFWPNQGAVSHVTLYGTREPPPPPPQIAEPGILASFGIGLVLLGFARRRRTA